MGGCEQGDTMTIIGERGADVKVGPCFCQLSILLLGVRDSKYLVSIQPQTWLWPGGATMEFLMRAPSDCSLSKIS